MIFIFFSPRFYTPYWCFCTEYNTVTLYCQ
nr:MAG TPA: hypothetical protein [Caudoviricetes sp.]